MKAVFLDRDGVITKKLGLHCYVTKESELKVCHGVAKMLKALQDAGFLLIVITNQSGVGKGLMTLEDLGRINTKLKEDLARFGVKLVIYFCPHDSHCGCDCRKSKPGMILRAIEEYNLELKDCWLVGDSKTDIQAGVVAGITKTILVEDCDDKNFKEILRTILGK